MTKLEFLAALICNSATSVREREDLASLLRIAWNEITIKFHKDLDKKLFRNFEAEVNQIQEMDFHDYKPADFDNNYEQKREIMCASAITKCAMKEAAAVDFVDDYVVGILYNFFKSVGVHTELYLDDDEEDLFD